MDKLGDKNQKKWFTFTYCGEEVQYITKLKVLMSSGPGSSVSIMIGYGLDGPEIESRRGARFSAPIQTSPGAHPALCAMGTRSFPGIKSCQGVTLTPNPFLVPWLRRSRAIPLLPYGPYGLYRASVPVQGCTLSVFTKVKIKLKN